MRLCVSSRGSLELDGEVIGLLGGVTSGFPYYSLEVW